MRAWADWPAAHLGIGPRTIAILPTAAIEQHGPHLPMGTDTEIMLGMLRLTTELAPEDLDLRVLPVQAVGKSNEHLYAPGTVTLEAETAIRAWTEIGRSVARAGCKRLIMVNSHGGNVEVQGIVARELRVSEGMLVVKCAWGAFGHPAGLFSEDELRFGIHGGDVETSLMLHFRPDLVWPDELRDFRSAAMDDPAGLGPTGAVAYAWEARDLNPAGVVGNAAAATADKGAATADHQARAFLALAAQVARRSLP